MYPEDSVQNMVEDWWVEDSSFEFSRGRLIRAFLPHVDQIPKQLVVTGRSDATDHTHANFTIEPLRIKQPPKKPGLPVAALPAFENEVNATDQQMTTVRDSLTIQQHLAPMGITIFLTKIRRYTAITPSLTLPLPENSLSGGANEFFKNLYIPRYNFSRFP